MGKAQGLGEGRAGAEAQLHQVLAGDSGLRHGLPVGFQAAPEQVLYRPVARFLPLAHPVGLAQQQQVLRAQAVVKEAVGGLELGVPLGNDVGPHMQGHHIGNIPPDLHLRGQALYKAFRQGHSGGLMPQGPDMALPIGTGGLRM